MSNTVDILADDGHRLNLYEAASEGAQAAVVVLQEIFGVNSHIRAVADGYAREGFFAVAPALFDRVKPGVELDYSPEGRQEGMAIAKQLSEELILKDIAAAIAHARNKSRSGKVGVVGYCLGGSYAWLSATRLRPDAAVSYYGSKVVQFIGERNQAPVQFHFGDKDRGIPLADVEKIQQARPDLPVYIYDAGHGFNCSERESYAPEAAALARERSLAFLREHLTS